MPNTLFDIEFLLVLGLFSGLVGSAAYLPYIVDTLAGRTQPLRASWLIWAVLSAVALASQIVEGAGASLWFAGAQVGATALILALSIWRGAGGYLSGRDGLVLLAAGAGLALWLATETSAYALGISVAVSLLGGAVTVLKAYRAPESETFATWLYSFFAAGLAMLAVGAVDWVLLAYPAYLFALNGAIVAAIWLGRRRVRVARPALLAAG